MTINTTHHSARVSLMTVICKFWKYEMRRYIPYLYCLIFDTFSTLFAGLHCWFGGETCTSQCHFQFIKVALIDNSSMHTRISSSGSCLKTLIWWNGCAMCWGWSWSLLHACGIDFSRLFHDDWAKMTLHTPCALFHVHYIGWNTLYVRRVMCCMPLHGYW